MVLFVLGLGVRIILLLDVLAGTGSSLTRMATFTLQLGRAGSVFCIDGVFSPLDEISMLGQVYVPFTGRALVVPAAMVVLLFDRTQQLTAVNAFLPCLADGPALRAAGMTTNGFGHMRFTAEMATTVVAWQVSGTFA